MCAINNKEKGRRTTGDNQLARIYNKTNWIIEQVNHVWLGNGFIYVGEHKIVAWDMEKVMYKRN